MAGSRIPRMLRTATEAVPRITPLAVEQDAATIAESTRIAIHTGAYWLRSVNRIGVRASGPRVLLTARATSA